MNKKVIVIVAIAITFLFTVLLFFAIGINTSMPPSDHKTIVNSVKIVDTNVPITLTAKCVDNGNIKWAEGLEIIFKSQQSYAQSTWLMQRYGDTEFVMTIWGPSEDGKTYLLEFGRVGGDSFQIKIGGLTKFTIPAITEAQWQSGAMLGYYQLTITLS